MKIKNNVNEPTLENVNTVNEPEPNLEDVNSVKEEDINILDDDNPSIKVNYKKTEYTITVLSEKEIRECEIKMLEEMPSIRTLKEESYYSTLVLYQLSKSVYPSIDFVNSKNPIKNNLFLKKYNDLHKKIRSYL